MSRNTGDIPLFSDRLISTALKSILYILSGTMLLYAGMATAATVDMNDARIAASDFLAARGIHKNISLYEDFSVTSRAGVLTAAPYYIYNIEGGGFVVVAGDDRARSVLAYSDRGTFDDMSISGPCSVWLDLYTCQIASLPSTSGDTGLLPLSADYYPSASIEPLLSSRWDQTDPYNALCPVDTRSGKLSVTGCVATATAQIMYYYRYPERPEGSVSYTDNTQGVTRSIDFSTITAFDWDSMTDTYDSSSSQAGRSAVATLMMAAGYASSMQYGSDVSIAYHRKAGESLARYFGYDSNLHYYERRLFSEAEWVDMLYAELEAGRPVLYDGRNPSAGHTFVCDGYDGDGRFHFNWGWSGVSDGYFSLSALNPGSQSTGGSSSGYTDSQAMVNHIAPQGVSGSRPQTDRIMTIYDLYVGDNSAYHTASTTPVLNTSVNYARLFFYSFNNSFSPFSGDIWAVTIDDGVVNPIVKANSYDTVQSGGYGAMIFELSKAGLTDGTYAVEFAYCLPGSSEWYPVLTSVDAPSGCVVSVEGNNVSLVPFMRDSSMLYFRPAGGSGYCVMDMTDQSLDVNVSNMGEIAWHGTVYGTVMRRDGSFVSGCMKGEATVIGTGSNTVTLSADDLQIDGAGSYMLCLYDDRDHGIELGRVQLVVTDNSGIDDIIVDETISGSSVVTVTDMYGRVYHSVEGLVPGVYIITELKADKTQVNKKIIIH